jgi:WhiB family redox-sensing transcriptional regulator
MASWNFVSWKSRPAAGRMDWRHLGLCEPDDRLFVEGAAQRTATRLCRGCPVQVECLAEALQSRQDWGIWGGLTERQRRLVLKRHPDVTDWRSFLEAEARRQGVPR